MKYLINAIYNVKYKSKNLEEAIKKRGYEEEFQDELADLELAFKYFDKILKDYKADEKRNAGK